MRAAVLLTTLVSFVSCTKHPHIIFIVADDLGWNDAGWVNSKMHTPNLNRLASYGITLTNNYVQPLCSPSRSTFMSAYYPFHTGLQHSVILWRQPVGLPLNLTTLPEALKQQGYATHAVGKWHLGFCNLSYTPTLRGFDSFLGYYTADEDYYFHDHEGGYDFRLNTEVHMKDNGTYSTFAFADRALDILDKHDQSQPLFLYLPFQAVHYPLEVPVQYEELCSHMKDSTRRAYCGMLAAMDEAIGNITDKLEDLGYMDNMLLVFTSDNGGNPAQGGSNWPLRGAKGTLWEGGTRAASFLYSKNLFRKTGTVHDGMMHSVDWFPTLMTLVDGDIPEGIDGVSQWNSIVDGEKSPRTEFVYNIDDISNNSAIRQGDWKLIQGKPGPSNGWYPPPESEIVEMQNTYEDDDTPDEDTFRLYNVKDDPDESVDVKDENPEVLRRLIARLAQWKESLVPANFPPDDPAADPANFDGNWSPGWC